MPRTPRHDRDRPGPHRLGRAGAARRRSDLGLRTHSERRDHPAPVDVHTISANGTLIPILPLSTPLSAPLYNLAGNALNLTSGQFSSATARSYAWTVTHNGTTYTQFSITMSGLVPSGVYSLFYRTFGPDSNNALCPNVDPTVALTAAFPQFQKPDPDSFTASSSGKGLFFASVPQDLLAAQQLQVSVIYHFNGQTYGPVANQAESRGPDPNTGPAAQATATTRCASSSSSRNELGRTVAGHAGNRIAKTSASAVASVEMSSGPIRSDGVLSDESLSERLQRLLAEGKRIHSSANPALDGSCALFEVWEHQLVSELEKHGRHDLASDITANVPTDELRGLWSGRWALKARMDRMLRELSNVISSSAQAGLRPGCVGQPLISEQARVSGMRTRVIAAARMRVLRRFGVLSARSSTA
jgi:hypothetical protein